MKHPINKVEYGDFQTPIELARECCRVVRAEFGDPHTIIEPTCGVGSFLLAALDELNCQRLIGYEINQQYRQAARRGLAAIGAETHWRVSKRDFFDGDWARDRDAEDGSVLYLGNPPWVTNAELGVLGSGNLPVKANRPGVRGIDALTGGSNFDIAESMLSTLLEVIRPDTDALAMLVKTSTARKVLQFAWRQNHHFAHASMRKIDAQRSFGVNADACLLMLKRSTPSSGPRQCHSSSSLTEPAEQIAFGEHAGCLVANPRGAAATADLKVVDAGSNGRLTWRSGVKHDLAQVVELKLAGGRIESKQGEFVDIEHDLLYPLAKGADVANGRSACQQRRILITQRALGEGTKELAESHPKTWNYLQANADQFASRKSSIYRGRDPFALFGIGPYTFAPWKVAICGLYKRLAFTLLGPIEQRPVIVDDTCYFLALEHQEQAHFVRQLLNSELVTEYLQARIFWDAKRPITAQVLRSLCLRSVANRLHCVEQYDRHFR